MLLRRVPSPQGGARCRPWRRGARRSPSGSRDVTSLRPASIEFRVTVASRSMISSRIAFWFDASLPQSGPRGHQSKNSPPQTSDHSNGSSGLRIEVVHVSILCRRRSRPASICVNREASGRSFCTPPLRAVSDAPRACATGKTASASAGCRALEQSADSSIRR